MKLKTEYWLQANAINDLHIFLKEKKYQNVLLVYGWNSIKQNGIYENVVQQLQQIPVNIFEVSEISPNPRDFEVERIATKAIENNIDLIIAIGGGSVIDASKAANALIANKQKNGCWNIITNKEKIVGKLIDIIAIPTIFGTASENNDNAVITNLEQKIKKSITIKNSAPILAILDTNCLSSLSNYHLSCAIYDAFNHNLEQYLSDDDFEWTNLFLINNMKIILKYATRLLKNRQDYEAAKNIVWTCSMSLNELSKFQQFNQLWGMHTIEHALSGLYDIPHGAGLAIITPQYIKWITSTNKYYKDKIVKLAKELFNQNTVNQFIEEITKFIKRLKLPLKWREFDCFKKSSINIDAIIKHLEFDENKSYKDSKYIKEFVKILENIDH